MIRSIFYAVIMIQQVHIKKLKNLICKAGNAKKFIKNKDSD